MALNDSIFLSLRTSSVIVQNGFICSRVHELYDIRGVIRYFVNLHDSDLTPSDLKPCYRVTNLNSFRSAFQKSFKPPLKFILCYVINLDKEFYWQLHFEFDESLYISSLLRDVTVSEEPTSPQATCFACKSCKESSSPRHKTIESKDT